MARTMTVDVGDELREFIDSLVKAGDYRTQSEVMRDALRLLREKQAESRLQELRDLLAEGISSGEAKPWSKDAYIGRIAAVYDALAMHDIGTHRAELGDNICSLPVEQHMIYFVSSNSVVTVIRILSQSQDTARHEPWR